MKSIPDWGLGHRLQTGGSGEYLQLITDLTNCTKLIKLLIISILEDKS
jgi:hypothetical protein